MKTTFETTRKQLMTVILIILTAVETKVFATADLKIDLSRLTSSMFITTQTFTSSSCQVLEQCAGIGTRKLLKFDTRTMNIGNGDLEIGKVPDDGVSEGNFVWDACHEHHHFESFAKYELFDFTCNQLQAGGKRAFAIINSETLDGDPPSCFNGCSQSRICGGYNDKFQGIGAGCADVYGSHLDCQWVDITGIPDGRYFFKVTLNYEQKLPESDYSNNTTYVLIEIIGNTVNVLYSAYSIPSDLVLQNIDNLPPPFSTLIKSQKIFFARNNLEIKGTTTFDDNKHREFVAGSSITISPDNGPVTISAENGGSAHFYIQPCLSTATFKMASNEGLFSSLENLHPLSDNTENNNGDGDIIEITDNDSEKEFWLFPNPAYNGQFNLLLKDYAWGNIVIYIYDTMGKLILKTQANSNEKISLDLTGQAKGLYSINIMKGQKIYSELIVIQ